jgi:hypothetical protein
MFILYYLKEGYGGEEVPIISINDYESRKLCIYGISILIKFCGIKGNIYYIMYYLKYV